MSRHTPESPDHPPQQPLNLAAARDALKTLFRETDPMEHTCLMDEIDAIPPEKATEFASRIDQLREAQALGLLIDAWPKRLDALSRLSTEEFDILRRYRDTLPFNTLFFLAFHRDALRAFDPKDPRVSIAKILSTAKIVSQYGESDNNDFLDVLLDKKLCETILTQQDPEAYVHEKIKLIQRFYHLLRQDPTYLNTIKLFTVLDEGKIRKLEELNNSTLASVFAETVMKNYLDPWNVAERNESTEEFCARVDLWQKICTTEILTNIEDQQQERKHAVQIGPLIDLPASWIDALIKMSSIDEFRQHLSDDDMIYSFVETYDAIQTVYKWMTHHTMMLDGTAEVEVKDHTSSSYGQQVQDIIDVIGLKPILNKCVKTIEIVPKNAEGVWAGCYHFDTRMIKIREGIANKKVASILIHEIGHAIEQQTIVTQNGQAAFNAYAAYIIYSGVKGTSSYAEATGKKDGRKSTAFVMESFAEDIRIFLQDPGAMHPERRLRIADIVSIALPNINIEMLRNGIRQMYGALYGISPAEAQRITYCQTVSDFARYLERTAQEQEEK